jgi:hypothetical protein
VRKIVTRSDNPSTRRIAIATLGGACLTLAASLAVTLTGAKAGDSLTQTAPSQIRRLTEPQYRTAIADAFGPDIKVIGRFEPDLRIDGLQAVGASAVSVTPAGLEQYEEIARSIAGQVTDRDHRDRLVGCAPSPADAAGAACARAFIRKVGLTLYRRPLPESETERLVTATLQGAQRLGDFHAGLAATLTGMLASPDFLFRIDRPDRSGRGMDGWSKASRLSYLLWNAGPDAVLLDAAAKGALDTPQGLSAQVDRMMASPRFTDGVRAFFTDYLRLDGIDTLAKDTLIYPAFTGSVAAATREQTLRTIDWLLVEQKGDYRDLFTTTALAMNRALGPIYDVPVSRADWYIHHFPAGDPRTGLLTHASILAQHSHPGRTSPTLRGVALTEIFLCEKVPAPPANVNFAVVQNVDNPTLKTTRLRLQAHLDDEECASCHKRTDPMGLGLEQFDGAGQFRRTEHDQPIDVTGLFEKRPFDGAAAMGKLFHDSPRVSACLAQSVWRYAHGRNPAAGDGADVDRLTKGFADDGYRFTALMRRIALDPALFAVPGTRVATGQGQGKGEKG